MNPSGSLLNLSKAQILGKGSDSGEAGWEPGWWLQSQQAPSSGFTRSGLQRSSKTSESRIEMRGWWERGSGRALPSEVLYIYLEKRFQDGPQMARRKHLGKETSS